MSSEIHTSTPVADVNDEASGKIICKLCRRQFAKYTCPKCNVPYCSLTCFRSSTHSQCSETFYKNELETDIASTPSRTAEERKQMMTLLKRFEEEAAVDEDALKEEAFGSGEDEGGDEEKEDLLVERFSGIDIDTLSSEEMWEMLPPTEKEAFLKALKDPTSQAAQRLLASEQLELELERPWWSDDDTGQTPPQPRVEGGDDQQEARSRPVAIRIPQSMARPIPQGHPLVYNLCAICIAYSHVVRRLGVRMVSTLSPGNPDFGEALRLIGLLVPFLLDSRSTTLHPDVGMAITDVYSRFEMGKVNSELLAVLLKDTAILMKPQRIVSLSSVSSQLTLSGDTTLVETSAHPHILAILVLSDLIGFFRHAGEDESSSEASIQDAVPGSRPGKFTAMTARGYLHVTRKLEFYIAHVLATPSGIMQGVADEALRWSTKVRAEGQSVAIKSSTPLERIPEGRRQRQLVEEIG